MVRETQRQPRPGVTLRAAIGQLPSRFRRFLAGVGTFRRGRFFGDDVGARGRHAAAAHTWRGAGRATCRAALCGAKCRLRERIVSHRRAGGSQAEAPLLSGGYLCEALVAGATAVLFTRASATVWTLGAIFAVSGVFAAAQDTLEGAIPPDLTEPQMRGTVYGTLGAVNGAGDLIASALLGTLWTAVSPVVAFSTAAALMTAGAGAVLGTRTR